MSSVLEKQLGVLEEERDQLRKELNATQEMLAHVLMAVGEVRVTKVAIENGLPPVAQIQVDEDLQSESFVFNLVTLSQEDFND